MPGQFNDLFAQLAKKFKPEEEKTLTKGKQITYVTARTVMNRLDEIIGAENWWDDYEVLNGADSILCRLTLRLPDGSTITKCDAGGAANMKDAGDDDKSMVSDAIKRAAARFGVGRYLYGDGVAPFVIDELTRAKEEKKRAKAEPKAETKAETPPVTLPESRQGVNEAFKPDAPPARGPARQQAQAKPERPANDKETVKLRGDRIGARGYDVRNWTTLTEDEIARDNTGANAYRAEVGLEPIKDPAVNAFEATRHMVKAATAAGAENPEPIGTDGKPKRVGIGKLSAHLGKLYGEDDWRQWLRREIKRYLAEKYRDAQVAANADAYGDSAPDLAEPEGQPEPVTVGAGDGAGEDDGWQQGRE
jgi:hypothetical protein